MSVQQLPDLLEKLGVPCTGPLDIGDPFAGCSLVQCREENGLDIFGLLLS